MPTVRDVNMNQGVTKARTTGMKSVQLAIHNFGPHAIAAAKKQVKVIAEEYLKDLQKAVRNYRGKRKRIATSTADIEGSRARGPKGGQRRQRVALFRTGHYYRLLKVRKTKESREMILYSIGAQPTDTHPPSGLKMDRIARILEFGDPSNLVFGRIPGPIPPRPHHVPSWNKFLKTRIKKLWQEGVVNIVKENWQ